MLYADMRPAEYLPAEEYALAVSMEPTSFAVRTANVAAAAHDAAAPMAWMGLETSIVMLFRSCPSVCFSGLFCLR